MSIVPLIDRAFRVRRIPLPEARIEIMNFTACLEDSMVRSIGVVIGSYVLSILLVLSTDPLLSRMFPGDFVKGRVPSSTPLMVSTAFFVVISIFCAWVCARFAGGSAARSVLWFFIVGEVMGIVATILNWSNGWPHWYGLAWLLAWPVSCWVGLQFAGSPTARTAAASS